MPVSHVADRSNDVIRDLLAKAATAATVSPQYSMRTLESTGRSGVEDEVAQLIKTKSASSTHSRPDKE